MGLEGGNAKHVADSKDPRRGLWLSGLWLSGLWLSGLSAVMAFAVFGVPGGTALADEHNSHAFFESRIRPVLIEHCYRCHSVEADDGVKGGLRLDSASGWQQGGDSGPAIVPGDVEASLFVQAIRYDGLEMPPDGRLSNAIIEDLEAWVRRGAPDPRTDELSPSASTEIDLDAGRRFWAFQPPTSTRAPLTNESAWAAGDIDAYILAALDRQGLRPAPDAEARTLVRRLYFDLLGIPPLPQQVEAFVGDQRPDKLSRLVDQLLHSPHFGQHWGRHWLDVARYADSNGGDFNATFHDAWRYRDYVVDALNQDKPFDDFVRQQIAGDLLPFESDARRAENLIATGFLMLGAKMLSERDKDKMTMDVVDEQINTIGQAFMGLTLGCARCHDHKFDPIPTADYYALAGAFLSTETLKGESQQYVSTWPRRRLPVAEERIAEVERYKARRKQLAEQLQAAKQQRERSAEQADADQQIQRLEAALKALDTRAPEPLPTAMAVTDAEAIVDSAVCVRGDHRRRGPTVPRGVIQVIARRPTEFSPHSSGRLEIANWLTQGEHPLTSRVMVNRVWKHLIGEGLVRSVDNFGQLGDRPSHPQLLDRLANEFVQSGWSIKYLVRRIALSRTYRMSTRYDAAAWKQDPDNRWLWRAHRRRLPAEAIRDAMLVISGQLDLTTAGTPVPGLGTLVTQNTANQVEFQPADSLRRSLYLPMIRGELNPMLAAFDLADPDLVVGRRATTNVPAQSLLLMNSEFVIQCAAATARLVDAETDDDQQRVQQAFRRVLNRDPDASGELARCLQFLSDARQASPGDQSEQATREALAQLVHVLFASTEFRMRD